MEKTIKMSMDRRQQSISASLIKLGLLLWNFKKIWFRQNSIYSLIMDRKFVSWSNMDFTLSFDCYHAASYVARGKILTNRSEKILE